MYYGEFNCRADVCSSFGIKSFEGVVIHAQYDFEDYDGSAFVIFANQGRFYLVEGSHCSCNGLSEDGFSPEEMSMEALVHMIREGRGKLSQNKRLAEAIERLNDLLNGNPDEIEMWVKILLG